MFYLLRKKGNTELFYSSIEQAHSVLQSIAILDNGELHLHQGGWDGYALSTVYKKDGDPLLDAVAFVRRARVNDVGNFRG